MKTTYNIKSLLFLSFIISFILSTALYLILYVLGLSKSIHVRWLLSMASLTGSTLALYSFSHLLNTSLDGLGKILMIIVVAHFILLLSVIWFNIYFLINHYLFLEISSLAILLSSFFVLLYHFYFRK